MIHRVEIKVRGYVRSLRKRWRHIGRRRVRVMHKLDESKVDWIVRRKREGKMTTAEIAAAIGVSSIWVKKLWARYKNAGKIVYPKRMGRPKHGLTGRREHSAILSAKNICGYGAVRLEDHIVKHTGIHIPHCTIHNILMKENLAEVQPKKAKRRKWIRYEREHSNSMWHTDYKKLHDGRWFIAYMDDASRFITGYGVFEEATGAHAIEVLRKAISMYGKPACVLTDRGTQFYANESEHRKRGAAEFEKELVRLNIRHILARVNHPQTNGKLERFHRELQRMLPTFEKSSVGKTTKIDGANGHVGGPLNMTGPKDPVQRLIEWYNQDRMHMSLGDGTETPAEAYARKAPPAGRKVIDEQTGEEHNA